LGINSVASNNALAATAKYFMVPSIRSETTQAADSGRFKSTFLFDAFLSLKAMLIAAYQKRNINARMRKDCACTDADQHKGRPLQETELVQCSLPASNPISDEDVLGHGIPRVNANKSFGP
jgi:hypothetical protein